MITIGADPEFGVKDTTGRYLDASDYFDTSETAEIGCDGNDVIGELRPDYAYSPRELADYIKWLIHDAYNLIPENAELTAGSMADCEPIGGHIHFGDYNTHINILTCLLDFYLAIPLAMIEEPSAAKERRKTSYGLPGDSEEKDWGFEYRTTGSWLTSYGVALSTLSLAYAVVDNHQRLDAEAALNTVTTSEFFRKFKSMDKGYLSMFLPKIWRDLAALHLPPELYLPIASLKSMIKLKRTWREGQPILEHWQSKHTRLINIVIGNAADTNCPEIARAVTMRAIGRPTFIYGLAKHRPEDIAVKPFVRPMGIDLAISGAAYGQAKSRNQYLCIGLSRKLREDIPTAVSLVEHIIAEHNYYKKIGRVQSV